MTVIKVENMHCAMCVGRIERALARENIAHELSLEKRELVLADPSRLSEALELLDELGFVAKQQ